MDPPQSHQTRHEIQRRPELCEVGSAARLGFGEIRRLQSHPGGCLAVGKLPPVVMDRSYEREPHQTPEAPTEALSRLLD